MFIYHDVSLFWLQIIVYSSGCGYKGNKADVIKDPLGQLEVICHFLLRVFSQWPQRYLQAQAMPENATTQREPTVWMAATVTSSMV